MDCNLRGMKCGCHIFFFFLLLYFQNLTWLFQNKIFQIVVTVLENVSDNISFRERKDSYPVKY